MTRERARLTIPNDLSYLPMALRFVRENALLLDFPEKAINQIELCVEEAAANVIQHGFRPGEDAEFQIICQQVSLGIKTIIKDKGQPFDPTTVADYDPRKPEDAMKEGGLGLFLIQQFMDEVTFHNLGRDGKELHLVKYLDQESLEESIPSAKSAGDVADSVKEPALVYKSIPFKVRKAQPKDAIEIAKCAYDAYRYSYLYEHVYYPERLGKLIETGEMLSAIAVTKNGQQVMAHAAIIVDQPDEKIAEVGVAFTKRQYQNQGCSKRLGRFLIKESVKKRLKGLWYNAVTSHVYSQKAAVGAGGKECAILLAYNSAAFKFTNFSTGGERLSTVLGYLNLELTSYLGVKKKVEINAPEHHKQMLIKICENLKETPEFLAQKEPVELSRDFPVTTVYSNTYDLHAVIEVKSYGRGIVAEIAKSVRRLCLEKMEVIYLYLNLRDPFTASLTKQFEDLGFFFSGIMPGPVGGHKLVLQYLNNIKIDHDAIHLYTNFSRDLLAYIKRARSDQKNNEWS